MEDNQEDKEQVEDPQDNGNEGDEEQDADKEVDEEGQEIQEDAMDILQYMRDTLRLSNLVSTTALRDGGLDNFEDLIDTTDDKIIAVVKNTRRPGGYILGAGAGAALVVNRGINFTEKDCLRVRQLGHYCYHMDRIQQPFVAEDATLPVLKALWITFTIESDCKAIEVPEPDPLTKMENIRTFIDSLDHYMTNKRGIDGVPLAYLVRKDVDPPNADDDPEAYGQPTFADELIRRAKHEGNPSYQVDNQVLLSVIRKLTVGGFAWSWVSSCARSQNSREAYLQLKTHYLGKSLQDKIQSDADMILENTFYDGKARNFTFEAYCTRLKQAFTDLAECGDELQESRKV
jgi:hypothetical protein